MVRERPVRLEVAADGVDRQPVEHRRQHRARHPVRRVDHDLERRDPRHVHERQHLLDERGPDVLLALSAAARRTLVAVSNDLLGPVPDLEETRLAPDREGAAADDLHARVLLRVVRGGDANAAVEPELGDGEVDHLRADQTDVEHVGASVQRALHERGRHTGRGDAHVTTGCDSARLEVLDVRAADRVRAFLVELVRMDAADVVGLEHLRVEHGCDASESLGAAAPPPPPRDLR